MSEVNENLKLEKITKLLEKGGTMLANHHDCGAPMFRYHGKIMCPVCESGEKTETRFDTEPLNKETETIQKGPEPEKKVEKSKAIDRHRDKILRDSVLNKVLEIAESLEDEQDLQRIKDKLACIEQGIKILGILDNRS